MKVWMNSIAILAALGLTTGALAQCGGYANASDKDTAAAKAGDSGKAFGPGCAKACCAKACCAKDKQAACCAKDKQLACKGAAVAASGMPLMVYKIGDQTTDCPKRASDLANQEPGTQVRYKFNGTEHCCRMSAMQAWAAALDDYLATMQSVRYAVGDNETTCSKTAQAWATDCDQPLQYRVGAVAFQDQARAAQAAQSARAAAEQVTMKLVLDDKEYDCPMAAMQACGQTGAGGGQACCSKSAAVAQKSCCGSKNAAVAQKPGCTSPCRAGRGAALAQESRCGDSCRSIKTAARAAGKSCQFVVGEKRTTCEVTATIELAKLRIEAAHQAIQEVAQKTDGSKQVAAGA